MEAALRRWAERLGSQRPEIVRVGYFGSYARGDHTPASDLDVVIEVTDASDPFPQRMTDYCPEGLPVGCDVFVYTTAEIGLMRDEGRRWWREIQRQAVWVWERPRGGGHAPA